VVTVLRWCLMNAAVTGQLKSIQNHLMSDYPTHQELTYTNKGTLRSARVYLSSEELYQSWHNLNLQAPINLACSVPFPADRGMRTLISVPDCAFDVIEIVPFSSRTRSCMLTSPSP
jgi:hypothetical protein